MTISMHPVITRQVYSDFQSSVIAKRSDRQKCQPNFSKSVTLVALCTLIMLGTKMVNAQEIEADTQTLQDLLSSMTNSPLNQLDAASQKKVLDKYGSKPFEVQVDSIEPEGGPTTGSTRVLVRGGPFSDLQSLFPRPKCKFGQNSMIVDATYVLCTSSPTAVEEMEGRHSNKNESCLQCEDSPESANAEIIPFQVSLIGDFSDSGNSIPFRYYKPTRILGIMPRYGPKDGQTFVQVWGENFLNFDENTRCNFGSKSVQAHYISPSFITCLSPFSDVVEKAIPFSISLNKQQNSKDKVDFWYYNWPQVVELIPNYGPETGGNRVIVKGNNFMPFNASEDIDNSNDTFCIFESIGKVQAYVINSTKIYCEAPPAFNIEKTFVEVTLNNQQYTDDNIPYFFYKPPQVFDSDPREGPTNGGTDVIVYGNKFKEQKNITCKFGTKITKGTFIDSNRISCTSPAVERAGYVPLTISYEGEKYSSDTLKYLYYDTPEVYAVTPTCGPVTGFTQITVNGKNFIDMGFGKVKCLFNNTFAMNATILSQDVIKCDTPPLSTGSDFVQTNGSAPFYNVSITLNGKEFVPSNTHFTYYIDPLIKQITPALGPMKGGTASKIIGEGFAQDGVCNLTVRYGPIQQKPSNYADKEILVTSPQAYVPDAVVVSVALNGQQFISDKTLHFRDDENTFTYYQDILITEFSPKGGPISGKTKIKIQGIGFSQFKDNDGKIKIPIIYVRFRDSITGNQIGDTSAAIDVTDEQFSWKTPPADLDTKAILEFSFNQNDWQTVITPGQNYSYKYYNAPKVTSISPTYGQVKSPNNEVITLNGVNFQCPDSDCKDLWIRFGESENAIYVKGERLSDTQLTAIVPKYSKPDVLQVEATFNDQDYTHDNNTYGFFDPFVLDVQPRLINVNGTSLVRIIGFGFVNAGDDLKTQVSSKSRGQLTCSGAQCIQPATYIDKHTIESSTYPQNQVNYKDNGDNINRDGMVIEASVTGNNNGFTQNGIQIWYYQTPTVISLNVQGSPINQEKAIFINIDFKWDVNDVERFKKYSNLTCRFTSQDGKRVIYTAAKMEVYPLGSGDDNTKPSHLRCNNPIWTTSEQVTLDISINGQDFVGGFPFTFYDSIDLYRIAPMAGPNDGNTRVKLLGSGFASSASTEQVSVKWGTLVTQPIIKDQVLDYIWREHDFIHNTMVSGSEVLIAYKKEAYNIDKVDYDLKNGTKLKSFITQSPSLPNSKNTHGGPMYMSVGESFQINQTQYISLADNEDGNSTTNGVIQTQTIFKYSNSKVEYYYYKQPVVKKVEPSFGLTRGGTHIEISGAWFAYRPEYGVVPHCKIGDKVTRAKFISTVRLVCISAPNDDINSLFPVSISLNGVDFVDTGFTFRFFEQPKLIDMMPNCGPETGGTQIYITGAKFSNISDPWNFKCRFSSNDRDIPPKFIPAYYVNRTTIMCSSPGGWGRGDSVRVQVTFNGEDYSENNFTFNYYNIVRAFPRSGPSDGSGGPIRIEGSGFRNDTEIYCALDKVFYEPLDIQNELITCPMVKAKQGSNYFGNVELAVIIEGNWHKFTGGFQYYEQIIIDDMYPKIGPSEGRGIIKFFGQNFREDFQNVDIGCKVGDAIGKGKVVDSKTINCTIEDMSLVDEGFSLPATLAMNSYSWADSNQTFTPYGIQGIYPNSGPYTGSTDILITGKGFNEEFQDKAKCRFGIPSDYAIVEAEIISYDKLICRSPPDFKIPPTADQTLSVPFGIAFLDEDFEPWTEGVHRFRFYKQPQLVRAEPDEVAVGKLAEVYVTADDNSEFWEPTPTSKSALGQYGIECKFGRFGVGIGMYVNKTTIKCVTPSISEDPDSIWKETVKLTVALNGQDFDEEASDIDFTFIGTGSTLVFWPYIIGTLLIGLLLIALIVFCSAYLNKTTFENVVQQQQFVRQRSKPYVIRDPYDQFTSRAYSAGMMGRPSSSSRMDGALSR